MLHESLLLHEIQELLFSYEIVFLAILLLSPGPARGVRYAEAEFAGELVEEALQDGGFAGARGPGDDDGLVGGEGVFGGGDGVGGCHGGGVGGEGADVCVEAGFCREGWQRRVSQA